MTDDMSDAERHWRSIAKPPPRLRAPIVVRDRYTPAESEELLTMFLPEGMEDKWLVLHDDGTMNFYRSWTGFHVYSLTFEPDGDDGSNVPIDAWASRDPDVWTVTPDDERDAQVLRWLVRTLVLRQSIPFPHDPRLSPADAALAAWSCAGNASLGILPGDPPPEPRARDARPPPSPRRRKRR